MSKYKITCEMCMDLMPLVQDGIASEDSHRAVEEHVAGCSNCQKYYHGECIPSADWEKSFDKFIQKMRFGFVVILMFGIFFGLSLTAGQEMFYNSVLMPVIGALGYVIFRWKSSYLVPILMFATNFLTWAVSQLRGADEMTIMDSFIWTSIYCVFVLIGVAIAGLVHWGIRKGNTKQKVLKGAGLITACMIIAGLSIFANALVGNPVSRLLATRTAKKHLEQQYGDTDYVLEKVGFNFKNTDYYGKVYSPSSDDTYFTLYMDMGGKLTLDNYEDQVTNGNNTARRLSDEYRALADMVLEAPDFPYFSERNIYYGDLLIESVEWESEYDRNHVLMMEDLELDGIYDVGELGKKAGKLVLHIEDEEVTAEKAAQIMLEIKRLFEKKNIGVYWVDFTLHKPRPEEGPREDIYLWVEDFLWEDISEDGLVERIQKAHNEREVQEKEKK